MTRHVVEFDKVGRPPQSDGRLDTPAFHRHHTAIWSLRSAFGGLYTCQITVARPQTEFSLLIRHALFGVLCPAITAPYEELLRRAKKLLFKKWIELGALRPHLRCVASPTPAGRAPAIAETAARS
jgi:hypothetical protein